MLRARALQDHGSPFICAFCRQKLPSQPELHRGRNFTAAARLANRKHALRPRSDACTAVLSQSPARTLSTTRHLYDSNGTNSPLKPGSFPGAFAGPLGGTFGAFASRNNTSSDKASANDGLLPHEREARQRSAVDATSAQTNANQGGQGKVSRMRPIQNTAQALRSRSVLADVFKTNREPRIPPTPKSWSTGYQQPGAANTLPAANRPLPASRPPPVTSSPGSSTPKDRLAQDGTKGLSNSRPKQNWGLFSHRKAEAPHHGTDKHGNESTVWSEITRHGRHQHKTGANKRHQSQDLAKQAKSPEQAVERKTPQDFWGELETRATGFKEKEKSLNQDTESDQRANQRRNADYQNERERLRGVPPSQKTDIVDPTAQRRKSRFETGEEEVEDYRKKDKKKRQNRRAVVDDDWDDETVHRWEQKQRRKAEKEAQKQMAAEEEQPAAAIFLPEYINASNLAKAVNQRIDPFLKDMEEMGFENISSDTIFTGETAALIAMEYGFEPTVDSGSQRDLRPRPPPQDMSTLPSRPPVVTIMGHVDHGKTTLLDWLRKSSVAAQEHGGITQHIGAFVVGMSSGKSITFLDTPGHAAFLSMRQRGANVTDIVVLVVAADDSVKPQTLEALKHANAAKVPLIVAINKIDKQDADIEKVKTDLGRHGVEIEAFGGDVQVVCVSGKTGQGMADLEENILTLSEILDVRAETDGMAEGWILESSIKPQGRAATVLVKRGTLRPGDYIAAGKTWARIRILRNEAGIELDEAPPGTPVEIMGWRELPDAGEQVLQAPDENLAKTAVEYRLEMAEREESSNQLAEQEQKQREKAAAEAVAAEAEAAGDSAAPAAESSEPSVILQNFTVKADVVGSVEAVSGSILELGNNEVKPKILRSSAGQITEYDVDHAATSNAIIINFNNPIQPHIKQRAQEAKVKILDHSIIYHMVDDAKAALSAILPMKVTYRVTGEADVLQVFPINLAKRKFRNIAGCRIRNGSIKKSSRVKVLRGGEVVFDGNIDTLKHGKKDVQEMGKGTECGVGLEDFDDFKTDDQIQTYDEIKEKRHL